MEKITEDLNFISSLPDQPTMATSELKAEFDKAGNVIKRYINDILIPDLETFKTETEDSIGTKIQTLSTELTNKVNTAIQGVEDEMTALQTSVNSQITQLTNDVNTKIAGTMKYSSFQVTRTSVKTKNNGIVYTSTRDANESQYVSLSGYYPIALVGVQSASTSGNRQYRFGYIDQQQSGKCLAHWFFANEGGESINEQDLPNCIVSILWAKM